MLQLIPFTIQYSDYNIHFALRDVWHMSQLNYSVYLNVFPWRRIILRHVSWDIFRSVHEATPLAHIQLSRRLFDIIIHIYIHLDRESNMNIKIVLQIIIKFVCAPFLLYINYTYYFQNLENSDNIKGEGMLCGFMLFSSDQFLQ